VVLVRECFAYLMSAAATMDDRDFPFMHVITALLVAFKDNHAAIDCTIRKRLESVGIGGCVSITTSQPAFTSSGELTVVFPGGSSSSRFHTRVLPPVLSCKLPATVMAEFRGIASSWGLRMVTPCRKCDELIVDILLGFLGGDEEAPRLALSARARSAAYIAAFRYQCYLPRLCDWCKGRLVRTAGSTDDHGNGARSNNGTIEGVMEEQPERAHDGSASTSVDSWAPVWSYSV
jgi:hypothetical protein